MAEIQELNWPDCSDPVKICVFISTLERYGGQMSMVYLAEELADMGHRVEIVVGESRGRFGANDLRVALPLVKLNSRSIVGAAWRLRRYLSKQRPDVLLAGLRRANFAAILARATWRGHRPRTYLVEHSVLSMARPDSGFLGGILVPVLVRLLYPRADGVVAVSQGVAKDLTARKAVRAEKLRVIYNPIVNTAFDAAKEAPIDHPWLSPGAPDVVLSVGRLSPVKNIGLLVRAFALLNGRRPARLIILGDGQERAALETLVNELGIGEAVDFAGYIDNPLPYMARCRVLALSSRWESFGNVMVEALACGAQVVSVDCPVGPREILDDGKFGVLVQNDDPEALAAGLERALVNPIDSNALIDRGRYFTAKRAAQNYADFMLRGQP